METRQLVDVITRGNGWPDYFTIQPPRVQSVIHNVVYVTPANFYVAALSPVNSPVIFRCQGAFTVAGILSAMITRGANVQTVTFNGGAALVAGAVYVYDIMVSTGDTVNFSYSANTTIQTFKVLEIPAAS